MDLDLTCFISLPWPSYLACFLHEFPAPERSVSVWQVCQIFSFLCWLKMLHVGADSSPPPKGSSTRHRLFENHTLTTIVVRLCRTDGGCPPEKVYFWDSCFMLGSCKRRKAWEPKKIPNESWGMFFVLLFEHENYFLTWTVCRFAQEALKHVGSSASKDFEVFLRRKMDSSAALRGRRREKDKTCEELSGCLISPCCHPDTAMRNIIILPSN